MRDLFEAGSLQEAQLLVNRLTHDGIAVYVRNGELQGVLGEIPFGQQPVVCVLRSEDWPMATQILHEFVQAHHSVSGPDLWCAECGEHSPGNFEVCWNCRHAFDFGPTQ